MFADVRQLEDNTLVSLCYPGSGSGAHELLSHADCFRAAALVLLAPGAGPKSRPPGRLCAIHAIELYFNAFLLDRGRTQAEIRRLQHDLAVRTALAEQYGMAFRQKTTEHLVGLHANREHLAVRYAPELEMTLSQINRLKAALEQVASAVREAVGPI